MLQIPRGRNPGNELTEAMMKKIEALPRDWLEQHFLAFTAEGMKALLDTCEKAYQMNALEQTAQAQISASDDSQDLDTFLQKVRKDTLSVCPESTYSILIFYKTNTMYLLGSSLPFQNSANQQGHYLGKGCFGVVKAAIQIWPEARLSAMKVMNIAERIVDGNSVPDYTANYHNEFLISFDMRVASHIGVLKTTSLKAKNGPYKLYMPMEYLGTSLKTQMLTAKWSFEERLHLIVSLLGKIHHMHRIGVAHGDIKPDNLLLLNQVINIVDFGLSKRFALSEFSKPTVLQGTPNFLPMTRDNKDTFQLGRRATNFQLMAREVLMRMQFLGDVGCDLWASRVLINMFLTPTMHEKLPTYLQRLLDLSDLSDVAMEQHAKITIEHLLVSFSLLEMGHAVSHEMTRAQCVSILEILDAPLNFENKYERIGRLLVQVSAAQVGRGALFGRMPKAAEATPTAKVTMDLSPVQPIEQTPMTEAADFSPSRQSAVGSTPVMATPLEKNRYRSFTQAPIAPPMQYDGLDTKLVGSGSDASMISL